MLDLLRAILARRLDPAHRLLLGQLVMFSGIAALFPIVPLYVAAHGGSSVDIAFFIAGPMVANTLVQVPAGHIVDRVGRKPVLIGSRLVFAGLCLGLFLDQGPLWLLALFRVGQGVSGGAYVPALRAALADVTPVEQRGRRYAQLQACEMVGLLVGPAIGGAIALWRYSGIFAVSGVAVLLGITALLRLPETRAPRDPGEAPPLHRWWLRGSLLVPAIGLAAVGAMFSMYDVVWPQFLSARGNNSLVIGLSISLFAVPILLLTGPGGRVSDRSNRRTLVPAALAIVACCAATYPLLRNLPLILCVGTVEAIAFVTWNQHSSPSSARSQLQPYGVGPWGSAASFSSAAWPSAQASSAPSMGWASRFPSGAVPRVAWRRQPCVLSPCPAPNRPSWRAARCRRLRRSGRESISRLGSRPKGQPPVPMARMVKRRAATAPTASSTASRRSASPRLSRTAMGREISVAAA